MPRIDPAQLLKCLSVLLSPSDGGGIKSKDEVQRLANLMTKFSKKLVSKCIYLYILQATDTVLLNMFMSSGGWDLTFSWLSDGVSARNWSWVKELLKLLLVCPVDIERLKTNSCPKLIKTLSKDLTAEEEVRSLACRLVEQWLRIVRGDDLPLMPSKIEEPLQPEETSAQVEDSNKPEDDSSLEKQQSLAANESDATDGHLPVYKITIKDGKKVLTEVNNKTADDDSGTETSAMEETEPPSEEIEDDDDDNDEDYVIKPVRLKKKPTPAKGKRAAKVSKKERGSTDSGVGSSKLPKDGKPAAKKAKVSEQVKVKADDKAKSKSVDQAKGKAAKSKIEVKEGNSKKLKESEEATNTKHKDSGKLNLSLKNRKRLVTEKEHGKFDKLHAKDKPKEKTSIMDMDTLTDKEKETLSKLITPPISKVGKIPKKSSVSKEEKPLDDKSKTSIESNHSKNEVKKQHEPKKEENSKDSKKVVKSPTPDVKREKEKKWSIEPKRALPSDQKPKTAKIYSAKFRSTGLEEEISKPPVRKEVVKEHPKKEKPPLPHLSLSDKKPLKRSSPPPPEVPIPEKKLKAESPVDEKKHTEKPEKPGIKLIPPKPRPMFLQESDVFMDAMLAANTLKEPRKRKRKGSLSKEHPEPKKDGSPNHSGSMDDPITSPSAVKPTFKFYQDTMDTSTEEEKADDKIDDENLEFAEPSAEEGGDDQKSMSSEEDKSTVPRQDSNGLKGVLLHLKSKKQKKSVTWKDDGLEAIRYFDLDENERVNVTKNFTDMKNHEKELEREHFLIARKLAVDDVMEERTRWQALTPIDMSAAAAVVAAGKNSQEKEIQYAREKTVPAAIYFNRRMIPDSPAEPDLEIHATTDPTIIPLEDITGSLETTNDFTGRPWPDPKGAPPPPPVAPVPVPPPGPFPPQGVPPVGPGPFPPMPGSGPFLPGPPGPGMPMPPGGDWRTGDGTVVDMPPGPPGMFPGPMMPPGMPMPMMMPLMSMPANMNPEDMPPGPPFHPGPFPLMGPPGPGPFPGPPGPGPQGNWQGPPPNGPNWDQQGPPPPQGGDRGGRFQGGGSWRGSRGSGGYRNTDNWRGNNRREVPLCNKGQSCRNNNCRFRHPR